MTAVIPAQRSTDPAATWGLVERARAGDLEAFGDLYRLYNPMLERFARRRLNGDAYLAQDIAAEVWVRAIRSIAAIEWRGRDVGAWLVTIARNITLDHYKRGYVRHEFPVASLSDVDTRAVDGVDTAVESRAAYRELAAAIERLTDEQREVIRLRFFHGLEVAETARRMGRNVGAIKAVQYRATRAIARLMSEGVAV